MVGSASPKPLARRVRDAPTRRARRRLTASGGCLACSWQSVLDDEWLRVGVRQLAASTAGSTVRTLPARRNPPTSFQKRLFRLYRRRRPRRPFGVGVGSGSSWSVCGAALYSARGRASPGGAMAFNGRILIVEDDSSVREMLAEYLAHARVRGRAGRPRHGDARGRRENSARRRAARRQSPGRRRVHARAVPCASAIDVGIIMVTGGYRRRGSRCRSGGRRGRLRGQAVRPARTARASEERHCGGCRQGSRRRRRIQCQGRARHRRASASARARSISLRISCSLPTATRCR